MVVRSNGLPSSAEKNELGRMTSASAKKLRYSGSASKSRSGPQGSASDMGKQRAAIAGATAPESDTASAVSADARSGVDTTMVRALQSTPRSRQRKPNHLAEGD